LGKGAPTKSAICLLRKWEKDVKWNGWTHKTQIKKNLIVNIADMKEEHITIT